MVSVPRWNFLLDVPKEGIAWDDPDIAVRWPQFAGKLSVSADSRPARALDPDPAYYHRTGCEPLRFWP